MKRILVALSLVALAAPAIAQNGAPYEKTQFDRGHLAESNASAGSSRTEASPFSEDFSFIAPAQ